MLKVVLLLLGVLTTSFSYKAEKKYEESPIKLVYGYEDLRHGLQENKYHLSATILLHSKLDCPVCEQAEDALIEAYYILEGNMKIFKLDCANNMPDVKTHCLPEYFGRLPDITFFQPEFHPNLPYHPLDKIRFQPKEFQYQDTVHSTYLAKYAENHLPWYFQEIEKKSAYTKWVEQWPLPVKCAYFEYFDEGKDSPSFLKMISADFRLDVDFAYVQSHLGIQKKGTFLLMTKNSTIQKDEQMTYREARNSIMKFFRDNNISDSLQGSYEDPLVDVVVDSWQQLEETMMKNQEEDLWVAVMVGGETEKISKQFNSIKNYFKDLYRYYRLPDIEGLEFLGINKFPTILVYPFLNRNLSAPIIVKQNTKLKVLAEIMITNLPPKSLDQTYEKELKDLLVGTLEVRRFPIVWFYDTTSIHQRLVTATFVNHHRFKKLVDIYLFPDPNMDKRKNWGFTRLPAIYCFGSVDMSRDSHKKWKFDGVFNIQGLTKFFNNIEETKFANTFIKQETFEAYNNTILQYRCIYLQEPCVVGLFNGVREGKLQLQLEMFKDVRNYFRQKHYNWIWIDRRCHQDSLMNQFGEVFNESDAFIYRPVEKNYIFLKEKLTELSLTSLIEDSFNQGVEWSQLENDLTLNVSDCEEQRVGWREEYKQQKLQKQEDYLKKFEQESQKEKEARKKNKTKKDLEQEEKKKQEEINKQKQAKLEEERPKLEKFSEKMKKEFNIQDFKVEEL